MKNIFRAFKAWFLLIFLGQRTKKPRRARDTSRAEDAEEYGIWYFKRDILEELDDYFRYIRWMKKTDPDGYRMYSKLGAALSPYKLMMPGRLDPIWKRPEMRPGFGAVAHGRHYEPPPGLVAVPMKIGYFRRIDRVPPTVEPATGQIYRVIMFHADQDTGKTARGISCDFYIEIDKNARIRPLRRVEQTTQRIQHHDAAAKRGRWRYSTITHTHMTYGEFLEEPDPRNRPDFRTPKQRAEIVFSIIATNYRQASGALRVAVTKKNITAMFGVDLLRTPYFFDEREATYTDSGKKKKIFHIVRTHPRRLMGGKITSVKSHFRGEREFEWKGYKILISMPGKHHVDLLDATFGVHEFDDDEIIPHEKDYINQKAFTDRISEQLRKTA